MLEEIMPTEKEIASLMRAVGTLKAMANPKRLAILCRLGEGEVSVGNLSVEVELSQSALSQHLAKLRELSLVATRRDQQTIYYRLDSPEIATLIGTLRKLYCD
ncbi:ArsR/SmtB family transcription factor [Pelagicoccus enzymogenes]|nr:metalloregulator ArsR/SmtB family transcription factor [Pelagicoccus enzymogenes]